MPEHAFEILVALCAGVGLAAAAGIRAFLPLLAVSIGARIGIIDLNPGLEFLSSNVALVALIIATLAEIASDKIPIVDNMLDVVSTFLRPVAGFVAALAMFGELPQSVAIATALMMAGVSLGTQLGKAKTRLGSTAATGGLANPLLSTLEDAVSGTLSFLAIVLPLVAGLAVVLLLWLVWKVVRSFRRARVHVSSRRAPADFNEGLFDDTDGANPFRNSTVAPSRTIPGPSHSTRRRPDPMEITPEP